ncbi:MULTISPECIES: YsnF/AvaK domain-containing protein [unclassified Moraxella]|uniref:YsnF/AvaK domain-containing protein n=1 Tax=unclassified Moraxella TaxID=2685852 RepID=UPI003AF947D2
MQQPSKTNETKPNPELVSLPNVLTPNGESLEHHTLELLAERAKVDIEKIITGTVKLSKQIKTENVNIPVTLTQEVLVIEHTGNDNLPTGDDRIHVNTAEAVPASIMLNGEKVTLGDKPLEVVISQQVAHVNVQTVVTEQIALTTEAVQHEQQIPVTLRHEELVVEENGVEAVKK